MHSSMSIISWGTIVLMLDCELLGNVGGIMVAQKQMLGVVER